ncbi:class I SAM-dependent DNA methyltransferase [Ruegeria sp. HKCCA6707]|uniref:type I restriction-modification system subunit M n=1 Tax=Ruegeria sp. HKCCA6707 TaxID=2682996 RepID=UPI001488219C|nr:class I SAM-dependent DNA methyltransferase [Ruegeria sp. HKCCA6707]
MNVQQHKKLTDDIWEIAKRLRGPYRPPQYRLVMLPMVVLRRLDCVLEDSIDRVHAEYSRLKAAGTPEKAMERMLAKVADPDRKQPLYNTSRYTFERLTADAENIAPNLVAYINGFSPTARAIFEKFNFAEQIEKLENSNRLFNIVQQMATIPLHPNEVDNLQMGYLFEHLVMKFNEQANEEAGDHFTPREVIELMANIIYTGEKDVYKPGIYRTIYDPTCGTGGMLSVSEQHIRAGNGAANLALFGQEYNDESWAICCSDMLIKDEETNNIILGDTLGDGKTRDGFEGRQFHYMLANPPFGVDWKDQKKVVEKEHKTLGFNGRFGAGTPDIDDGSLLFLQHMISKMHPNPDAGGDGSKIAVVFNGSPLFSGSAGGGPSSIRRWIIENDWLDAIIGLPDQLFYNTGIHTYIWLVTNRKPPERRGQVQLIDGTLFAERMDKSLNNKRHCITDDQIAQLTRIYGNYLDGERAEVVVDKKTGEKVKRTVSRVFKNHEFGFLRIVVERPLRMNFQTSPERIARLDQLDPNKHPVGDFREVAEAMDADHLYMDLAEFDADVVEAAANLRIKLSKPERKTLWTTIGDKDQKAEECIWVGNRPEPDAELRDTENVPLPDATELPLPMAFGPDPQNKLNGDVVNMMTPAIDAYMEAKVKPHVPDAWVDYKKTKVGYEIPFNRHFYVYKPPRELNEIECEIETLEVEIAKLLEGLTG